MLRGANIQVLEFDGVIVQIDFNKTFKGHTIIRQREFLGTKKNL